MNWTLEQLPAKMREQAQRKLAEQGKVRVVESGVSRELDRKISEAKRAVDAALLQPKRPPSLKRPAKMTPQEVERRATERLLWLLRHTTSLPEPVRQHRFHELRRWRFDLAWPLVFLAVEIEGGIHGGRGAHIRPKGFVQDMTKYNEATIAGWRLIRVTHEMIRNTSAVRLIKRAYG